MQVEDRARSALRHFSQARSPGIPPALLAVLTPPPTFALGASDPAARRQVDFLNRQRKDSERVDDVNAALAPGNLQHAEQARAERRDLRDATAERGTRREALHEKLVTARESFQSTLRSARGQTNAGPESTACADELESAASKPTEAKSASLDGRAPASPTPADAGGKPAVANSATVAQPAPAATSGSSITATTAAPIAAFTSAQATPTISTLPAAATTAAAQTSGSEVGSTGGAKPAAPTAGPLDVARLPRTAPADERTGKTEPAPETTDRAENIERMLRVLRGELSRGRSKTVIRLDPPELGSLRLELDLRKDVLRLKALVETDAAHRLLRDELETLRSGLEAVGIRLASAEFRLMQPDGASAFADFSQPRQGSRGESAGQNDDRPRPRGTESHSTASASAGPADVPMIMPAAEPRLNIIA
ncbi:MAG: flagellar hook-length control protein FliK [Planctomycetes bacterium]|nr:flagellar hook-length control protein FliK [Planctomycetota bacterium]